MTISTSSNITKFYKKKPTNLDRRTPAHPTTLKNIMQIAPQTTNNEPPKTPPLSCKLISSLHKHQTYNTQPKVSKTSQEKENTPPENLHIPQNEKITLHNPINTSRESSKDTIIQEILHSTEANSVHRPPKLHKPRKQHKKKVTTDNYYDILSSFLEDGHTPPAQQSTENTLQNQFLPHNPLENRKPKRGVN